MTAETERETGLSSPWTLCVWTSSPTRPGQLTHSCSDRRSEEGGGMYGNSVDSRVSTDTGNQQGGDDGTRAAMTWVCVRREVVQRG